MFVLKDEERAKMEIGLTLKKFSSDENNPNFASLY
jgi:hypothetical protein